jgi:hypothetical protein
MKEHHMEKIAHFGRVYGLHPLVAVVMIAVDVMLFGPEAVTGGLSTPLSVIVAGALMVPCTLMQRYGYKDDWGQAIGKSMIVCILTAIPTALPAILTGGAGLLGGVGLLTHATSRVAGEKKPPAIED